MKCPLDWTSVFPKEHEAGIYAFVIPYFIIYWILRALAA
ncbi:hypothetical protein E6C60_1109 [Paenibacillus algicola]|uniref:Uncharacterized protein n=1 Tax=Paenibacillus algicola TaxID=2565926 RepID=A0A4P8XH25_9BACL|nr:hypothetical protein E6C60_1109 [Paenibacillus algicola]